jgi:hypothetical protein
VLRMGRSTKRGKAPLLRCGGCDGEVGEAAHAAAGVGNLAVSVLLAGWGDHFGPPASDRGIPNRSYGVSRLGIAWASALACRSVLLV